jgi:hypothetical protein
MIFPRRADGPAGLAYFARRAGRPPGRRLRAVAVSINPLALTAIANAIQTQEGYYPGSLAYRNNNPGNLMFAGQDGATAGPGGFAVFASYDAGYQALENQINLDATRGSDVNGQPVVSLADLITSWAPPDKNDTAAYISFVSGETGIAPDTSLLSVVPDAGPVIDTSAMDAAGSDSAPSVALYAAGAAVLIILLRWLF